MKIGELARRGGVSIRALHHYDAIGLLQPSRHTPSGHRLYDREDLDRLGKIRALQRQGFSLEEIQSCLSRRRISVRDLVESRLRTLRSEVSGLQEQARCLEVAREQLLDPTDAEEWIVALEKARLCWQYFTSAQRQRIAVRVQAMGEARVREWKTEGAARIALVREEMEHGTDPGAARVGDLLQQRRQHFQEFTAADPDLEQAFGRIYHAEPWLRQRYGVDDGLYDYLERATSIHH
jgi:DNA-binding transcriptional MerR regulator